MKTSLPPIDATPSKRLYVSIMADYDVNRSVCKLIDNALDIRVLAGLSATCDVKTRRTGFYLVEMNLPLLIYERKATLE